MLNNEAIEENIEDTTSENKDCGNLPQNKEDKKNKWLLLVLGITTVIIAGFLTTKFLSKDSEPKDEPIDYMQYVQGIQDLELTSSKDKYDYLSDITFDKEHINSVTVDASQVDLTKAGEYQLTYLIDIKDENAKDLKQVVTVKVVSDDKKEDDKKPKDTENKDKPSSSQNQTDTNNQSKPSNTGSSNNNTGTNSQPSNNSSSNNTNNKPTTHTHRYVAEYRDIQHEEKGHYETVTVSEAWDEDIYDYRVVCNCGAILTESERLNHSEQHLLNGQNSAYSVQEIIVDTIHHPAKTEKQWVVDENGWTETVTIYKCSCGATK